MDMVRVLVKPGSIEASKELVTIVGAGGKTGTMFALARELRNRGKRVLVSTTTAIYKPEAEQYDQLYTGNQKGFQRFLNEREASEKNGEIVVWGKTVDSKGKLQGVAPEDIDGLWKDGVFSWILVEGDGAKKKSIKAPREGEPVIPRESTVVMGVMGMTVLGKRAEENRVHRLPIFSRITGINPGEVIGESGLRRLILDARGLFKGTPEGAKTLLLLNQCEDREIRKRALALGKSLSIPFVIASVKNETLYHYRLDTGDTIVSPEETTEESNGGNHKKSQEGKEGGNL